MLKKYLIFVFSLLSCLVFSQKKKAAPIPPLASYENITAEISSEGGKNKLVAYIQFDDKKEKVVLKELTTSDKTQFPTQLKITSFTISGVKLYHFSYVENIKIETKLKKEETIVTSNEIWEFSSTKVKILGNIQKTSKIKETVFLDKNKTASETQEKTRREGFDFSLTKENDVILSNKTQSNRYKFNPETRRFDPKK